MICDQLVRVIDRLVEIGQAEDQLKSERSTLEAELLRHGQTSLQNTKLKTVSFEGSAGKATVTMSDSLKLIYPTMLQSALGDAYNDAVKAEIKFKVSAPMTRMLVGLWSDSYTQMTVAEVIDQLPVAEDARLLLRKKLRGANYAGDKAALMAIGGFAEQDAAEYAYFVAEAAVWESFLRLMKAGKHDGEEDFARAIDLIKGAVIVEETPKVTITRATEM